MVSRADIARDLDVDRAMITRWAGEGMPTTSLAAARAWHASNVNRRVRGGKAKDDDVPGSAPDYQESRAWREAAEAELAQIKVRKEMRELVEAAAVKAEWSKQTSAVREGLLNIPARLAPVLAAETSASAVQQLLDAEIRAVVTQFVGEPE